MSLTWDLTGIDKYQELCWVKNTDPNKKEGENFSLNPVTEAIIHLGMFTGIPKITAKNYKELSRRFIELEILGIALLPQEAKEVDSIELSPSGIEPTFTDNSHIPSRMMRNPRPFEVKLHIGLVTNVAPRDNRKWGNEVRRIIKEQAQEFMEKYTGDDEETEALA